MAAPSYVNAQTGATDAAGAWSYTCQASAAAGRVFIVQILQDGASGGVPSDVVGTNIESLDGTDNTWTLIGKFAGNFFQSVYIGRALSTSAPTISGGNTTSDDLYIRSYQFTDVSTGTTLATVIENGTAGGTDSANGVSNTAGDAAVITLGPDRLALQFIAVNDDNTIPAWSGPSITWAQVVAPYAESSGTDGAIALHSAAAATAATYGGSETWAITDSDAWVVAGFALIGTTVVDTTRLPRYGFVHMNDPGIL